MKANVPATFARSETRTLSQTLASDVQQKRLASIFKDPALVARFTSTLIGTVAENEKLAECTHESLIAAALKGVGLGLDLSLGQFSIVPYGDKAQYQPSYKGYAQLAMRSGEYTDIDVMDVREGEYRGKNPKTGKPLFEFIEDDEQREAKPIVGYYAYFELKDGFFRSVYWSRDKILKHADRYSKAFNLEEYNRLVAEGKDKPKFLGNTKSPWYDTDGNQQTMCKKTVLKQLLNSGFAPLSVEMKKIIASDEENEQNSWSSSEVLPIISIDNTTGEVVDTPPAAEIPAETAAPKTKGGQDSFFED